ncbi:MAG: hypothetical protein EBR82_18350 [Caulobacteraceae bacterium]|nr:hypothetical protein [Caulobacteraceae bacterium]
MVQLDLFRDQKRKRQPPIARTSDKPTSHDAAKGVSTGSLQGRCVAVLIGEMTANEIAHAASQRFFGMPDSYRKRVHELVRKQQAVACGTRVCNVTGINATTYRKVTA